MADYKVSLARSARKELESLPGSLIERIWAKIEGLAADSRPAGCKKLIGANNLWRIRVGEYRIIYAIDDPNKFVDIVSIRHRKDAYR